MSREKNFQGVVLKKMAFGEADELITFFTKESGKIRILAKSVKLPKAKLQHALQPLFLDEFVITDSRTLPRIIQVTIQETWRYLRESPERVGTALVGLEIVLKATPDESVNTELFTALVSFLRELNSPAGADPDMRGVLLLKFKLELLQAVGLGVAFPLPPDTAHRVLFSAGEGGFVSNAHATQAKQVGTGLYAYMQHVLSAPWVRLPGGPLWKQANELTSELITYQLERTINSEKFI